MTAEEVKTVYWRGGPEAHESTDVVFLKEEVGIEHQIHTPVSVGDSLLLTELLLT